MKSAITTHVLDTSVGRPGAGMPVRLDVQDSGETWTELAQGVTDANGRLETLLPEDKLADGVYRLTFDTDAYFRSRNMLAFFPSVRIVFSVRDAKQHYHIPLLLSPYGYSTYRGS
ncbi:MAG: hydroxyisourate hydrolase [Candidatus Acidiferrales bacterium]